MSKIRYLFECCGSSIFRKRLRCPFCDSGPGKVLRRRYLVSTLRRCPKCFLIYRTPTESTSYNSAFYQTEYSSEATQVPKDSDICDLNMNAYVGAGSKDFSSRIAVLDALQINKGSKILDFGASWGYGTWQLNNAGFEAHGYEISKPRVKIAREKLSLTVFDTYNDLIRTNNKYDVVFSNHVLEHLPTPSLILDCIENLLIPGGLFVAFTPNGSDEFRRKDPQEYDTLWNRNHPLFLDSQFYQNVFSNCPILLSSTQYNRLHDLEFIKSWNMREDVTGALEFSELLCVVQTPQKEPC